jgi:hypothetical protein
MEKTSTGNCSTGNCSTGDWSTGDRSTGNWSTGNWSTGNWSTGDRSTGNCSTGDWSTGDWSTGNRSTGDRSTGYRSTGNRSTGNWSTGNWSTSSHSTGNFSTIDFSGLSLFNVPITKEQLNEIIFPSWIYFDLTKWISEENMSEQEKNDNPNYSTTKGYLKVFTMKEAWLNAYNSVSREEQLKIKDIPHFDADVFFQISGIRLDEVMT